MPDERQPIQLRTPIDWSEISKEYRLILSIIQDFRVPKDEEIRADERELLVGIEQVDRVLHRKFEHSFHLLPGCESWMSRGRKLSNEMNRTHVGEAEIPEFQVMNWQAEIEAAIELQHVSMEFLEAWWRLGAIFGRAVELEKLNNQSHKTKSNQINSGKHGNNRAREVWYARWLIGKGVFIRKNGISRTKAEWMLLELCDTISRGHLKSPLKPSFFNAEWFSRFVVINKDSGAELSTGFSRLTKKKILELAESQEFPSQLLPPANDREFQRNDDP